MGTSYSPNIVKDGLIFYIDAANPKSYPKSGTVVDSLMGGYSGSFVGDVAFSTSYLGNWEFSGNTERIDFGQASAVGFTSALDPQLNNFTANVFFRINSNPTDTGVIMCKGCGSSNIIGWLIAYSFGGDDLVLRVSGQNTTSQRASVRFSFSKSKVHMATLVIDRTNNQIIGYLDGKNPQTASMLENDPPYTPFDSIISSNKLLLGSRHNSPLLGLQGNIYLAQIYNRALSANEVLQNYNALKGRFL
jgi:hypothetical protein